MYFSSIQFRNMKIYSSISILIITLLLTSCIKSGIQSNSTFELYGDWEFEKIKIEGIEKSASALN